MLLHGQVDKVQDEARKAMTFWTIPHILLQVDAQRDEARKAYQDDQQSKEKQEVWKGRVVALKAAQANLRTAREAYYKCVISFGRLGSTYSSSTPAGAAPMLAGAAAWLGARGFWPWAMGNQSHFLSYFILRCHQGRSAQRMKHRTGLRSVRSATSTAVNVQDLSRKPDLQT